ncbi:DNA/RNA non-specific endonuclease [Mucilaginibacter sp. Bleaf8]|uniref:DNA/RNA non-specific endonuclease n=1 Tax=Mucilaginibacter sp. Bleaf8 TaxID=2834430 RepID=UPI001BCB6B66|nr:DNA/RNA non-specific endonuclease [Mucilaginibacter sp. Bleaf8]MBS7565599.1 DNA/RNA non-specific endonuclease [Mucilaginibacter sp. Bleaf8]
MKIKNLLIYLFVPLIMAGCKKSHDDSDQIPDVPNIPVEQVKKPFTITEDFENGSKPTGYIAGDVAFATGSWSLDGAFVGNAANDIKNGKQSIRLRGTKNDAKQNGIFGMNFDIRNVQSISIKSSLTNFADNQKPGSSPLLKGYWELQVSKDGGKTYSKIGETVNPTSTTELTTTLYNITDTVAQRFRIVNTSDFNKDDRVRLSIDDITFTGLGNSGVTVNIPDTNPGDNGGDSGSGTPTPARGITIGADVPPNTGDNSNLLFGNPSLANGAMMDNYLIDQGYYVESYSATRGTPNWVSWHLDESNTTNATGRLDNFAAFSGLPTGYYQVQSTSYSGSGFDRGHNCPSADRTSSTNANSATFLMTNMIPQAPNNNQQTWNNLEGYLRTQVTAGNEVYIIMGNYGKGGVGSKSSATVTTIDNGHVIVPANVWKVAVIIPKGNADLYRTGNISGVRVLAVNTPNVNSIDEDWKKYVTTVRAIETAMGNGFNLLSNLPQAAQDALETKTDSGI